MTQHSTPIQMKGLTGNTSTSGFRRGAVGKGCSSQRFSRVFLLVSFLLAVFPLSVAARYPAGPFTSYVLNQKGERVPAPVPFTVSHVVYGETLGIGRFSNAKDMFIDNDGFVYVVDTGNNRVVKLDQDARVVSVIGSSGDISAYGSYDRTTSDALLNQPSGIYVTDQGEIFIADTGNSRIAVFDKTGEYQRSISAPRSTLLGDGFQFRPTKLVVELSGLIYVINGGDYRGLMQITQEGEFLGWYAPNRLPFDIARVITRVLSNAEQMSQLTKPLPAPHDNVFIDYRGFLWTVSAYEPTHQIKRMATGGGNIYPDQFYGQVIWRGWNRIMPAFTDIAVDDRGIVTVIDRATCLVYQYNLEGDLLAVYGGQGVQKGLFQSPSSVIVDGQHRIWVLDSVTGLIQILESTDFQELIYEANNLYINGMYEEAGEAWQQVISMHTNFRLARRGLGKSYYKQERWKDAMHQFYLGRYRGEYSRAFGEYIRQLVRDNFLLACIAVIAALFVVYLLFLAMRTILRLAKQKAKDSKLLRSVAQVLRVLYDADEVFWEVKQRLPVASALVVLILALIARIFSIYVTSFHYSLVDPESTSMWAQVAQMFVPLISWIVATHGVAMILECEGKIQHIMVACSLCLLPYVILSPVQAILTNVVSLSGSLWIRLIQLGMYFWIGYLFLCAIRRVYEYRNGRSVSVMALGAFLMVLGWAVVGIVYSYSMQVVGFVQTVLLEVGVR